MPRTQFSKTDLNQLRRQLDTWRQAQSGMTRLPEALWKSAAALAATHGVGQVARTLRLDYHKLKGRAPQAPVRSAARPGPAFVELAPRELLPNALTMCRIELSNAAGAKMTVELPCDTATVLGLAQAFWRRG